MREPQPSKLVWIVRINPDGSEMYYFGKGKMTERRALSFCSSWQAWYDNQYLEQGLVFRFITREKTPKQIAKEQPMLYWVYDPIGRLTNDGPVRPDIAEQIINEHEDYTMSEAC